jgi:hypothetical protein
MATKKIGRDAKTGKFIPVKEAERRKSTAVVETIKHSPPNKPTGPKPPPIKPTPHPRLKK